MVTKGSGVGAADGGKDGERRNVTREDVSLQEAIESLKLQMTGEHVFYLLVLFIHMFVFLPEGFQNVS